MIYFWQTLSANNKLCHKTTWTGPERRNEFKDKEWGDKKKSIQEQIDYILIKRRDLPFVRNSHSYGGIGLNTDNKLVKAEL